MRTEYAQHWISKTREGTYNTPESTGTNYERIPTTEPYFHLPKLEKVSDANRLGQAAPTHLCNTYWQHSEMGIRDDVETGVPARLLARALGGTVSDSVVTTDEVWDHEFAILDPAVGDILPSFSWATKHGDASFLLAGCMVDRFRLFQQGADRVQYEADLVGSGKFTLPHGLTSLPDPVATVCMDGWRTTISYDDSGAVDLSTDGRCLAWSVEFRNNIRRNKRRLGDPTLTASNGYGAHVRKQPRGKYETIIQLTLDFDHASDDLIDWKRSVDNKILEDLTFTVKGPIIETTNRHEFEIIVPRFSFEMVDPADDDGDSAVTVNVIALEDPVSGGTITARVRNALATLV